MSNNIFGKISLGSDPEIFVTDMGKPWGASCLPIKGTKDKPEEVPFGAIQIDGLALEFNIDPANSLEEWVHNNMAVKSHITGIAEESGLQISTKSMLDFNDYIDNHGATEDELLFGCDPDFNADTMKENTMPDNDGSIKLRTTGGHVHIGMEKWSELVSVDGEDFSHLLAAQIVKVCDLVLGVWSVLNDDGIERKKLYGKAGAYRVKPYGVEYRTLSNFWIFNKEHMEYIYNTMTFVMVDYGVFQEVLNYAEDNREDIVKCINTNNRRMAQDLLNGLGW